MHARALTPSLAGVILEYERTDGSRSTKIVDLLQLSAEWVPFLDGATRENDALLTPPVPACHFFGSADLNALADTIVAEEALIGAPRKPQLRNLLQHLLEKQIQHDGRCVHHHAREGSNRGGL